MEQKNQATTSNESKEESTDYGIGCFPIDFALGGCEEILGLKKHKEVRQQLTEKLRLGKNKSWLHVGSKAPKNKFEEEKSEDSEDVASGGLPTAKDYFRAGHSADFDGKSLYIFGGYNGPNELYVLRNADTLSQIETSEKEDQLSWEKVIIDCNGRAGHTSFLADNRLYIYGGYNDAGLVYEDMFYIDVTSGKYETTIVEYTSYNSINLDRRWHCAEYLPNSHRMLVHGGWNSTGALGDTLLFDLESRKWETPKFQGEAPCARRWHSMTHMLDRPNQFLIYGGYAGNVDMPLNDFYMLDIERQKWFQSSMKGQIPGRRNRHTLTPTNRLATKEYLLLGGRHEKRRTNRQLYFLHTDDMSWTCIDNTGPLYAAIRGAHRVTFVGDYGIVVAGGLTADYIEPFYYVDTRMFKQL